MVELADPFKIDFRNFLAMVWDHLGLPEPAPIQMDVAFTLQHAPDRFMCQALRGFGKSYETAALAAWLLYLNPDLKILCISAANIRATEFVGLTRQIIETLPITKHLIPREGQRDGAHRFDVGALTRVAKDPSVAAYGITSMIVGTHVDVVICDDVETQENSITVEARDKLEAKCLDFENILNPGGRIIYLGTPQTRDSVYNRLTAKGYKTLRWPARYPGLGASQIENLAPFILEAMEDNPSIIGQPTFPEKFPDEMLTEREAIMGPSMFALQMMLDTTLADEDRYPLKLKDFIVFDCRSDVAPKKLAWGTSSPVKDIESVGFRGDMFYRPVFVEPEWDEFSGSIMWIDPSGRGHDELAVCVSRHLNGKVFVPFLKGYKEGYEDFVLEDIAKACLEYDVRTILHEPDFGDGMFAKLLIPVLQRYGVKAALVEDRAKGQKEKRILQSLEPAMTQHRVVIDPLVARDRTLMQQVTQLTEERGSLRHDDRVEALAGAIRYWVDQLAIDTDTVLEQEKSRELQKEIRAWNQAAMGLNPNRRILSEGIPGMPQGGPMRTRGGRLRTGRSWLR